jgi:hypothetical protein
LDISSILSRMILRKLQLRWACKKKTSDNSGLNKNFHPGGAFIFNNTV